MKIVYVVESLGIAGGVKVIVEHAEGLADRGHEVVVVTKDARHDWIPIRVPVVEVPVFDATTLPEADVHVATWFPTVVPTVRAARARRVFHFSQGYEAVYPDFAHRRTEIDEAYAQEVPKLLISRHLVGLFEGRFPGPFHVIPQAIRVADYAPRAAPDPPRAGRPALVGVVGPYEAKNKGIPVALEALRALREAGRDVHLRRASQMKVTDEETALFPSSDYLCGASVAEMIGFYRGLDLLIHPSFEAEGFPLPPLEAMASGVPVVLTAIPSFEPLPDDAVLRVSPGDSAAMAQAAARLLDDVSLWTARRERGLDVAAGYGLDRAIDVLEEVFDPGRRSWWRRLVPRGVREALVGS